MNKLTTPDDLKQELDNYINQQKKLLDNEISNVIETNRKTAQITVAKKIARAQRQIQNQNKKKTFIKRMVEFLKPKRK
jgi:hypothetical protein